MRRTAILLVIASSACRPSFERPAPEESAPSGGMTELLRVFSVAMDAYPKPDTTNLTITTSINNEEVTAATQRLAELRRAQFVRKPRICGCVDPHVGPTRVPTDVDAGECDWIAQLREIQTQVNINIARDSANGSKVIGLHWQTFTPGRASGDICTYSRQWSVELQQSAGAWRVASKQCWLAAGRVEGRNVNPRGSGCGGWYMRRPGGS